MNGDLRRLQPQDEASAPGGDVAAVRLDTSGEVLPFARYDPKWNAEPAAYRWPDLSPFTQGYVEALLNAPEIKAHPRSLERALAGPQDGRYPWGFSDLAPETLARIMEDCDAALATHLWGDSLADGRLFWSERHCEAFSGFFGGRQDALLKRFPPQSPHLGDDGKVYLRVQP